MSLMVNYSDGEGLPAGKYIVRLDAIEEKPGLQYGDAIQWTFTVVDKRPEKIQFVGKVVTGLTGQTASPKAKITAWLGALGIFMEANQQFDIHSLIGTYVVVNVIAKASTNRNGQPTTFTNVDQLVIVPQQLQNYIDSTVAAYVSQTQSAPAQNTHQNAPAPRTAAAPRTTLPPQPTGSPAQAPINRPVNPPQGQPVDPSKLISDEDINF